LVAISQRKAANTSATGTNDDQPYVMSLDGGGRLISVPYSHEINDKLVFERLLRTADEFRDMICRQFDVLYREGAESGRVQRTLMVR
jgi:allantoinase